jgi:hypothetical protein
LAATDVPNDRASVGCSLICLAEYAGGAVIVQHRYVSYSNDGARDGAWRGMRQLGYATDAAGPSFHTQAQAVCKAQ